VTLQVYLNVIWFDWRLSFNTTATGGCMSMPRSRAPVAEADDDHGDHSKEGPTGDISYGGDLLGSLWQPTLYAENMIQVSSP
tara:strand:+ start:774 stop:1019 length:246 start_codon:yes stop_codon:yes gene_type:complete